MIGKTLGHYSVWALIGRGGMGSLVPLGNGRIENQANQYPATVIQERIEVVCHRSRG